MKYSELTDDQKFELLKQEYMEDGADKATAIDTALGQKDLGDVDETLRKIYGYQDDSEVEL